MFRIAAACRGESFTGGIITAKLKDFLEEQDIPCSITEYEMDEVVELITEDLIVLAGNVLAVNSAGIPVLNGMPLFTGVGEGQFKELLLKKIKEIEKEKKKMLTEMLTVDRIQAQILAADKQDAICMAGRMLVDAGLAEEGYIQGMLDMCEELSSYIVIMPGVAMPHARPERGAKKPGLALLTLKVPIKFGHPENDPVRMVVGLCAPDKTAHLVAIRELSKLLCEEDKVEQIFHAADSQEIYDVIAAFEKTLIL